MAPRPRDDYDAKKFPACLDCGSTGGVWCGGSRTHQVHRKRGLCGQCYDWHRRLGTHIAYPLVTTHGSHVPPQHPDIPSGFIHPWQLGIADGQHAILAGGHELARRLYADAEAYAAAWLGARALAAA